MTCYRSLVRAGVMCKLIGCIAQRRVRDRIKEELQPQQAAFGPARLMLGTLTEVAIPDRLEKSGKRTLEWFIGYTRIFGSVSHTCIANALKSFGVDGRLSEGIKGFLRGRAEHVRVSGGLWDAMRLVCGVSHGLVLGPLLFNVAAASLMAHRNCIHALPGGFVGRPHNGARSADGITIQRDIQEGLHSITK
ncbi:putative Reverse transcriptase (RNA dependent DNA polymerase) [Trypanosoma vivax]|nr:putative Reverse transcriptase (RNA dependent DNA polymerase) [Trypanosoma vivax]